MLIRVRSKMTMKTSKTLCGTVLAKIGMAALAASVACAATADGDAPRRPMLGCYESIQSGRIAKVK